MNNYTIYCTSEQTRKAFELGAPIEKDCSAHLHDPYRTTYIDGCSYCKYYCNPTAEEMMGWLEDKRIIIIFMPTIKDDGSYRWVAHVWYFQDENFQDEIVWIDSENLSHLSRKKVTLAAIDAALEYLSNNK